MKAAHALFPLGSLRREGRWLVVELGGPHQVISWARRTPTPELPVKAVVVMAGDHGVADEGVSAFPQAVTGQMVRNFAGGGAAINVLARQAGAQLVVVDMGVKEELPPLPGVRLARVASGTRNMARGPAMTRAEAVRALETGIGIAEELVDAGVTLIALGEMGIANTTAASALTAAFTGGALAAARIAPDARGAILASHRSVEAGHRALLQALGTKPLLDLDLRLGEGTGGALAMAIVEASVRVLREMASFDDAGVSGAVR